MRDEDIIITKCRIYNNKEHFVVIYHIFVRGDVSNTQTKISSNHIHHLAKNLLLPRKIPTCKLKVTYE